MKSLFLFIVLASEEIAEGSFTVTLTSMFFSLSKNLRIGNFHF